LKRYLDWKEWDNENIEIDNYPSGEEKFVPMRCLFRNSYKNTCYR